MKNSEINNNNYLTILKKIIIYKIINYIKLILKYFFLYYI